MTGTRKPLAFVSYDYKHNESEKDRFLAEKASCSEPFEVEDWSAASRSPRSDWEKMVHARISRCDFMIVLIDAGMDMKLVEEEIVEAKRANVPFFGVYVGEAPAATELPADLGANRTIPWDWERIASAVRQVGGEGKHHIFR